MHNTKPPAGGMLLPAGGFLYAFCASAVILRITFRLQIRKDTQCAAAVIAHVTG